MESHLKIIEALANGIDPLTGEVLPSDSLHNNPEIIRSLFAIIDHIKTSSIKQPKMKKTLGQKRNENIKKGLPENAGLPWNDDQRDNLTEQFKSDVSREELAELHGRTKGAISSELKKLGLIEE
jgi:hypothetical protein